LRLTQCRATLIDRQVDITLQAGVFCIRDALAACSTGLSGWRCSANGCRECLPDARAPIALHQLSHRFRQRSPEGSQRIVHLSPTQLSTSLTRRQSVWASSGLGTQALAEEGACLSPKIEPPTPEAVFPIIKGIPLKWCCLVSIMRGERFRVRGSGHET